VLIPQVFYYSKVTIVYLLNCGCLIAVSKTVINNI